MTSSKLGKLKLKTQDETRYGKIVHEGILNKRSKGKSWNQRYAVLWEDMGLRFYETESRGNVVGKIKMKYINEIKKLSLSQCSELDPTSPYFFAITSGQHNKTWHFGCSNDETLSEWVHILQSALTINQNKHNNTISKSPPQQPQPSSPENKYIGHIGHNMSNMEDFSVAHSMSSRASSIQSLSALQIMIKEAEVDEENDKKQMMDDIIEEDGTDDDDFLEMEVLNENYKKMGIIQRLQVENTAIIFEGQLERKTGQKVLGKHLWETRYFKLSTHSLSIYTTDKSDIVESVIKLSSIISVLNIKNNGLELNNNRFDINMRDKVIALRTENEMDCQKWISYLSQSKKKHRKSIRTNLKSLEQMRTNMKQKKQKQFKKFKRQGSQLDMTKNSNDDGDGDGDVDDAGAVETKKRKDTHSRNLSMQSWVNGIEQKQQQQKEDDRLASDNGNCVTNNYKFEGFLIRQVGLNGHSEKIYFRLSYDTLEFSKIDANIMNKNDINKLHNLNIMGTISVEHIKNVKMVSDSMNNKFIITFDSIFNENNQWILKTEKNNQNYAIKWVDILQQALINAKSIVKTINEDQEDENDIDDDDDGNNSNNSDDENNYNEKRKKQIGSLKALQQMINDETIQELEMAQHNERHNQNRNVDVTKDMIELENKNKINNNGCGCIIL